MAQIHSVVVELRMLWWPDYACRKRLRKKAPRRSSQHTAPRRQPTIQENPNGIGLLEYQVEQANGEISSQVRRVSAVHTKRAQEVIGSAMGGDQCVQMNATDQAINILDGNSPKPSQQEARHRLIYLRRDLVLKAGTGFGKSIILQAVSVLHRKTVTIGILLPLD